MRTEVFYDVLEQETQNHEIVVSSFCTWNPTCVTSQVRILHKFQSKGVGSCHYMKPPRSKTSSYREEFHENLETDWFSNQEIDEKPENLDMSSKTSSWNLYREGFHENLDTDWFSNHEIDENLDMSSKTSSGNLYREGFHENLNIDWFSNQEIDEKLEHLDMSSHNSLDLHAIGFNLESEDPDQTNSSLSSTNDNLSSFSRSNSTIALERGLTNGSGDEAVDSFYRMYTERMRWFDILCRERLFGINAIVHGSWNKMERKMLARSLESDLELIYVAQMCLSWEALYYQYRKVESIISTENEALFQNCTGDFQKFQILLERFMEDENFEKGKRYSKFIHKRFSFKSLLHVPDVKGYVEEENGTIEGEPIRASEALKVLEKCIKAFLLFVKSDNKPSWKLKSVFEIHSSRVEDPKDLELFYNLTKALQKKGLLMKDMQGKKKCWLKRKVNPVQRETEKIDALLLMIDMKLVEIVLKMSIISTSHLEWCREKLNNLEFKEGKIFRAHTKYLLFPTS